MIVDTSLNERIRSFAGTVRAHLDDLPADDADDITTGLVADLQEEAADSDGAIDLNDPAGYAAELRAAAGLPPRGASRPRPSIAERTSAWRRETAERIRGTRFGAWALDLLISLRPVWWVLRGYVVYAVLAEFFRAAFHGPDGPIGLLLPGALLGWIAFFAATLVSIQWGRGRWLPQNGLRHMRTVASVVVVIALPFVVAVALTPRIEWVDSGAGMPGGLMLDGVEVGNIFAYDANGNPLTDVQLFAENGEPLNLIGANRDEDYVWGGGETLRAPLEDFRGQPIWNVYPLYEGRLEDLTGELDRSTLAPAKAPFEHARTLSESAVSPAPTPSPSPTATPSEDQESLEDAPAPEQTPES